jgi:hypothetical protein
MVQKVPGFQFGADDHFPVAHLCFTSAPVIVAAANLPSQAPFVSNLRNMKWSCFLGQFCDLAKMHLVCVHAAFRVSTLPNYAMSCVRLSRAV